MTENNETDTELPTFSKKTWWLTNLGIFILPIGVFASGLNAFGMLISVIAGMFALGNGVSYAKEVSEQFNLKIIKKNGQDFSSSEEFDAFDKSVKSWIRQHSFGLAKPFTLLAYFWLLGASASYPGENSMPWWDVCGFLFLLVIGWASTQLSFEDGNGKKIDLMAIWKERAEAISKQIFNRLKKADAKDKENTKLQKQLDDLKEQIAKEAAAKLETLEKQEATEVKAMGKLIAQIESEIKSLEEISERHPEVQGFLATRTDTSTSIKLVEQVKKKYSL